MHHVYHSSIARGAVLSLQTSPSLTSNMNVQVVIEWYYTRDVFYVRREVDLMKAAEVNAYIMYIF